MANLNVIHDWYILIYGLESSTQFHFISLYLNCTAKQYWNHLTFVNVVYPVLKNKSIAICYLLHQQMETSRLKSFTIISWFRFSTTAACHRCCYYVAVVTFYIFLQRFHQIVITPRSSHRALLCVQHRAHAYNYTSCVCVFIFKRGNRVSTRWRAVIDVLNDLTNILSLQKRRSCFLCFCISRNGHSGIDTIQTLFPFIIAFVR